MIPNQKWPETSNKNSHLKRSLRKLVEKDIFNVSTGATCGTTIMKGLERFEITYACIMFHSPKMVATVSSHPAAQWEPFFLTDSLDTGC